jgi:ketosteroid isomerase-like protein
LDRDPRQVIEQLIGGISKGAWLELDDLYAESAVIEYPFALPEPRRLEGRQAIRRYFQAAAKMQLQLRARNVTIHETGDPEVVVVEYDYDGLATATGRSFHVANIQVSRFVMA